MFRGMVDEICGSWIQRNKGLLGFISALTVCIADSVHSEVAKTVLGWARLSVHRLVFSPLVWHGTAKGEL